MLWPALIGGRWDVASCDWPEDCRRRRARAARQGYYFYDDAAMWADVGFGRVLRGRRLYCRWRRRLLWLARGLTQAAGAGREVGGFDAAG